MLAAITVNSTSVGLDLPVGENWQHIIPVNGTQNQFSGGTGLSQRWLWKVSDGTEPATADFVFSAAATQHATGAVSAYTGVDTDNPFDVSLVTLAKTAGTASDGVIPLPAITPITTGAWIVRFGAISNGALNITAISGPAGAHVDRAALVPHRRAGIVMDLTWAGGTEAQANATATAGNTGVTAMGGISIALKPGVPAETTPPSDVTGLNVVSSTVSQVNLGWTAATDNVAVAGYNLYRKLGAGGTYAQIATVTGLTYTDAPPAAGTYFYVVKAKDAAGNLSVNNSNEVSATTTAVANGTVRWRRVGAATNSSFVAGCNVQNGTSARLKVSTAADLSVAPAFFGSDPANPATPATADVQGYVKIKATGLSPLTTYYFGWEVDGGMTPFPSAQTNHGKCATLVPTTGAQTSKVVVGSCQTSLSNSTTFTRIAQENPSVVLHMGDEHYDDRNTADQSIYRTAFEQQIGQVNQQAMEAVTPMAYMYNDHDFCGNNSSRDYVGAGPPGNDNLGRVAVETVYRQIFPHYDISATTGAIWHTFSVGRVKFFIMDTRSESTHKGEADSATKTKLGAEQKQAFKDWALANKYNVKVVATGEAFQNDGLTDTQDGWNNYRTEHNEIISYITTNSIGNGIWLSGDQHACSYADSSTPNPDRPSGTPAGWPVVCAAPFDQTPSHKGGPWSKRTSLTPPSGQTKIQQYGILDINDTGLANITVTVGFRDSTGATILGPDVPLTFNTTAPDAVAPAAPVGLAATITTVGD